MKKPDIIKDDYFEWVDYAAGALVDTDVYTFKDGSAAVAITYLKPTVVNTFSENLSRYPS